MDKELALMVKRVLIDKTNTILDEIEDFLPENKIEELKEKNSKLKKEKLEKEKSKKGNSELKKDNKNSNKTAQFPNKRQFSNLMHAAEQASSVEELLLFIAYQESKENQYQKWKLEYKSDCTLAQKLEHSLVKMLNKIQDVIMEQAENKELVEKNLREIRLSIAKKYLGYLYWKVSVQLKGGE